MMGIDANPETLISFDHLTELMAREDSVKFIRRESFKWYTKYYIYELRFHQPLPSFEQLQLDKIHNEFWCSNPAAWNKEEEMRG